MRKTLISLLKKRPNDPKLLKEGNNFKKNGLVSEKLVQGHKVAIHY